MSTLVRKAEQADTGFKEIPIIKLKYILARDLANISSSDPAVQQALATEVRDACINVGFFYVRNHDIPEETIRATLEVAKEFFALPLEAKMKVSNNLVSVWVSLGIFRQIENKKTPNFKGYSPLLSGNNNPDNAGDLQEGFEFGWEPIDPLTTGDDEKSGVMVGANVWPSELPDLREKAMKY
ncbi:hypothetical protein C0995_000338 [Termitomyces sp. Mi166|nr:hypothetical protein C0995_000338 [Termitomyces sp. Mi166\